MGVVDTLGQGIVKATVSNIFEDLKFKISDVFINFGAVIHFREIAFAVYMKHVALVCLKFIYSEKATKFCKIPTVDLTVTT